jgi:glucan phosphoethanolaminetransferase (alkaline phosphatase superfamily)
MKVPKAASLLLVFVLAKAAALAGHHVPFSWWSPIAYLWQDAVVVLVFAAIELCLGPRQRLAWIAYASLALYAAINIPVERALSTPLTWPMWRAARGPLSDSMWYYATWQNALLFASVLAVAVIAPLVFRRTTHGPLLAALVLCVALGPASSARVDTFGLERNPWTALISGVLPRMQSRASIADWRAPRFDRTRYEDLSRFRGAAAGRNVVLVSLESTAAQYLGLYGANPDVMPNLSELARTAIVFDNAYAVYPESIKGLFSILCSTYPAFDSEAEMYATVPCQSVAAVLSASGYRTALFHSGRFMYLGMEAVIRNRGFETLADAGEIGGNQNSSFGVDEPSTVASILRWIDALPVGQPFFVTYLPIAGHHPYETPEPGPFPDRDDFGRYRNALHYGDASLGTLIRGLRARGLDQKTLWIILGDHGEAFGQHEANYGHTFQLYDENVRVPFLLAAPGVVANQIHSRQVVSLIDTAPTVLDLEGLRPPENYQGRSMLDGEPRMALFFADYSLGMLGLRDGPRKFIHELESGRSKLFDVEKDPQERMDLSDRHVEEVRWYTQDLRSWSSAQRHLLRATR